MKPCGGVGGLTSANALAGGEGSGGEGVSNGQIRDSTGIVCNSWCDLALCLEVGLASVSPGGDHWLGWVQHLFPPYELWGSLLGSQLWHKGCLGSIGGGRDS